MSLSVESLFGLGAWRQEASESHRRFGVPPGGPWDREAATLCRALARVDDNTAVFELLQGTVVFRAHEILTLSVVGIKGEIEMEGQRRSLNRRVRVEAGSSIRIQAHAAMIVASPTVLAEAKLDWAPAPPTQLRFLPTGSAQGITAIVDPTGSRAGLRLNSESTFESREQPSEPSCVGAIQSTPSGQLILIGPDGPTIGGYSRIGTIIDADLDLIPRLDIGQTIELTPVDVESALRLYRERQTRLDLSTKSLKIVRLAEML